MARIFPVARGAILTLVGAIFVSGCSTKGEFDDTGGIYITRSSCPAFAVPTHTGEITLFNPPASTLASAIDVEAVITNVHGTCQDVGENIAGTVTFDVLARRTQAGAAREVTLPYFIAVVRGTTEIMAKRRGQVTVRFAEGAVRAQGSVSESAHINRAEATLPEPVRQKITRRRSAQDADATIDPLTDPEVKGAVQKATFEVLVGFQLTSDQLRHNATR